MTEAITVRESDALMPIMDIATATQRYRTIVTYVQELMNEGTDFGKIPGTEKNTLLKPGAEKLCTLFGLSKRFQLIDHTEEWDRPFFNYLYRCSLYRGDLLVAEADGSCNSHETKYRWRKGERKCPSCGVEGSVIKGKEEYGGGWLCWTKKNGCGAKFHDTDERITSQVVERVPNPDIADQVNTMQKMAQKRALIAATLLAVNASEFFTQDLEDFTDITASANGEKPVETKTEAKVTSKQSAPRAKIDKVRKTLIQSVADAFKLLNELGDQPKWTQKTANAFVAQNFEGVADVDGLDDGQVSDLLKLLSERVDNLKSGSRKAGVIKSIKTNFDSDKHLQAYLDEKGLKPLEELSISELDSIDRDVSIPF
jgi:hypothetical protein